MKDPDKMSERELRREVKSLRDRIQTDHDAAIQIGYDRGFPAGVRHERARVVRIIRETPA